MWRTLFGLASKKYPGSGDPGSMYDLDVWGYAASTRGVRVPRLFGMAYSAVWRLIRF